MKMVKSKLALSAAVAALALSATAANAAVTFTSEAFDQGAGPAGLGANEVMVLDFDLVNEGTLGAGIATGTTSIPDVAAQPPGNQDNFGYITANASPAVYTLPYLANSLSIYIGSLDSYNTIRFLRADNSVAGVFAGGDLTNPANGNQSGNLQNRRFYFDFHGDDVAKIEFITGQNSFEFDNVAISAVPEPGVWALMIAGFGMMGAALRRRRNAVLAA